MRRKLLNLGVLVIALGVGAGCSSTAIPGAENVRITEDPKDVAACKLIEARPSAYVFNTKAVRVTLQDFAMQHGGDTVLLRVPNAGVIYNCKGVDTRQPVPVAPPK